MQQQGKEGDNSRMLPQNAEGDVFRDKGDGDA